MGGECFMCVEPASEQYTLVLESSEVFEDKWICDECLPDLRTTDWVKVREEPVLMRCKESEQEEPE
jgi:hypothetical protein